MTPTLYNPAMPPNVAPVFYDLAAVELLRRREREKEERMKRLTKTHGVRREVFHDPRRWQTGLINQLDNDDNIVHEEPHDDVPDDLPNPHLNGEVSSFVLEDHGPADDITEVIVIITRSWLPEGWLSLSTRARSS